MSGYSDANHAVDAAVSVLIKEPCDEHDDASPDDVLVDWCVVAIVTRIADDGQLETGAQLYGQMPGVARYRFLGMLHEAIGLITTDAVVGE